MTIQNPAEWGVNQIRLAGRAVSATSHALHERRRTAITAAPRVNRIGMADLKVALTKGFEDFAANRSDVIFISLIYPLAGLVLAQLFLAQSLIPMIFPLVSGFALISPFAATGLYEISRRRERDGAASWSDALGVFQSPSFGAILGLGLVLLGLFALWMLSAMMIYGAIFGDAVPVSAMAFASEVLTTGRGWALIAVGCGVGLLFAVAVLAISAVSFPMLLDRPVGLGTAVRTSVGVVRDNPRIMMAWGLIVAASLVAGAVPALLGLIVAMPVLGHATWHLYRRAVSWTD